MYNEIKKLTEIISSTRISEVMNICFRPLHRDATLRTAFRAYKETNLDVLPVVDEQGCLIGVCPKRRLYKAFLQGNSLDQPALLL